MFKHNFFRFCFLSFTFCVVNANLAQGNTQPEFPSSRSEILNKHIQTYKKYVNAPGVKKSSDEVIKKGNRLYLEKNYADASKQFSEAGWPNLPDPHYFVMLGDMYFRAMLQSARDKKLYPHQGQQGPGCWTNIDFAWHANHHLQYDYEMGFDIATALNKKSFLSSPLYKRAYKQAGCIRKLIEYPYPGKENSCISLDALEACLGESLIK